MKRSFGDLPAPKLKRGLAGSFWGENADGIAELFVGEVILAKHVDVRPCDGRMGRDRFEEALSAFQAFGLGQFPVEIEIIPADDAVLDEAAAEIERELISAGTAEALRARKASGLPLGRPKGPGKSKLDKYRPEIEALLANGSTQKFIAGRYGTTQANLHNWIRKHGLKKAPSLTKFLVVVSVPLLG